LANRDFEGTQNQYLLLNLFILCNYRLIVKQKRFYIAPLPHTGQGRGGLAINCAAAQERARVVVAEAFQEPVGRKAQAPGPPQRGGNSRPEKFRYRRSTTDEAKIFS
jgi:hypothetical protein